MNHASEVLDAANWSTEQPVNRMPAFVWKGEPGG